MDLLKNRHFQLENLEERTLLTAAPWSTADEPDYSGLVVTTLEDVVDASDHYTSIREAISYAESLDTSAEITFAEGLRGKITLTGGALQIDSVYGLAIDGDNRIAFDAGGDDRGFEILSGPVTLANLEVTGGFHTRQGGAIASSGDLTLDNVTVTDSYAGRSGSAVYIGPGSHLTVIDSVFTNNNSKTHGGGLYVEKTATADITGSYFTNNSAGSYGAAIYIWNGAVVNVSNTVFFNNDAPNGTLRNYGGTLTMTNVVISGNDQGFSSSDGGVNVATNVTISKNTLSAVRGENGATFTFYNSVLIGGETAFDLRTGATIDGDTNLSTAEFGSNFVMYDGGDLFAKDGYTPVGHNQLMGAGNASYNVTEYDAVGNNRYYGGTIDIGAVEQTVYAYGASVVFNGENQMPVAFTGPVAWAQYSFDGETWSDELDIRNVGSYTFWVNCGTDVAGEDDVFQVTGTVTPLQLTVSGSAVADKEQDGTTDAEILVGDVATLYDDVTVVGAGQFASPELGTWDVATVYAVEGDLAGNYIAPAAETLKGTIIYRRDASLVVTTLEDVVDPDDDVNSLREAVAYAETLTESATVTFADGLEGVIRLAGGAISFAPAAHVTVDGGNRITVDAGGEDRAFEIASGLATLANLTLTGGFHIRQGGAIASSGDLTLSGVTVSDSYSGKYGSAVYITPGAHLTVVDSTFVNNASKTHGGGIYVEKGATADISGSYFDGNSAGSYGAAVYIWNEAVVNISDSIFVNNIAPNGTLRNYGGTLNLTNVVIVGNDQGISSSAGGVNTGVNVTISGNFRSAVRGEEGATFTFYNSVLMNESDPEIEDQIGVFDLRTRATAGGDNNLSTVAFGTNFVMYDGGDLFAADGFTPVGENQLLNAGNGAYNDTEFDAAGNNRFYDGVIDIGAVEQIVTAFGATVEFNGESQSPVTFDGPLGWAKYSLDGETWTDELEIRDAGTYAVLVNCGTDSGDEELYEVTVVVTPLQLTVSGSSVVTKDYDGTTDAEINVGEVAPLYDDVTVVGAGQFASPDEGTWDVEVTYTVVGDKASNYVAPAGETLRGTILMPEELSLVVTTLDDTVDRYDNQTSIREAIAYAETFDEAATVTFADGLEGTVSLAGGAIQISSGNGITVDGADRIAIDARGESRAFEINADGVTLANISIENGYAEKSGGAISAAGDLTLEGVTVSDSYSGKFGGAVYAAPETHLTIVDSSFTGNTAQSHGGAVFVDQGAGASISGSYFSGNTAQAYGGAVYVWNDAAVDIANSIFVENIAPNGTIRNHGGQLNLINVVVSGNEQGISAADGGVVTATNVTISNNARGAVRGDTGATFFFYNSILLGGYAALNLDADAAVGGDNNLSDKAFGNHFILYDGGDLFAEDGYTLYGNNQAMSAGNAAYNDTEFDAVGNNRYYGGALDLGAVEQVAYAYGASVVFNGEAQAPVGFYGPVAWAQYSSDGESWSDTPSARDAGTYTFIVKVGTG
ncbi:MAG: right-handed parallel beta-helix repeat-containing protein, partial [Thermoguttaceae bacterium]|nr:right-handed parallel beta-helix repeat-containing protein [Thermoguttaceae bacterium]